MKCSVTGCKSNYDSNQGSFSVFTIPSEEQRRKLWLRKIPRKNWTPGPTARVCELHFDPKFISRTEEFIDKEGNKKLFPRKRPILLADAVPTKFHNLPAYLSCESKPERNDPEKRRKVIAERQDKAVSESIPNEFISSFNELLNFYKKYVNSSEWKFEVGDNLIAYIIDFSAAPKVKVSLKINSALHVTVYQNGFEVPSADLEWVIAKNNPLTHWFQFESLLNRYAENSSAHEPSQLFLQETVSSCMQQLISCFQEDEETAVKLKFLSEQFKLAFCCSRNARRYSPEMLVYSFMIHMLSPACYDALRSNSLLTLPHENRLIQLTRSLGAPVDDAYNNKHFLQIKCDTLQEREKYVVLQLDEIYVKRKIDYKNGKLFGHAKNGDMVEAARTIVAVLISSAFGNFKEVVMLRPVNKVTGDELTTLIKESCLLVKHCGFKIIVVVSDNHSINRTLFRNLCGIGERYHVEDNICEGVKTFCTFDSVHVGKCLRNNWLNQKDPEKTFRYPCFSDFKRTCSAKFAILREIYSKESGLLIKTAPKLNFKTVYPCNLERQQVGLALNVWHESTIAAVKRHTDEENETAAFLEIIWTWWNIMNIKNKYTHIVKRLNIGKPFDCVKDDRLVFLRRMLEWLDHWKPVRNQLGFLTEETYTALYQQTAVMIQFIEYSLTELKIPYVLPGKIQTDVLEKRFGRYRSLSGNNYNISVVQVCEDWRVIPFLLFQSLKNRTKNNIENRKLMVTFFFFWFVHRIPSLPSGFIFLVSQGNYSLFFFIILQ